MTWQDFVHSLQKSTQHFTFFLTDYRFEVQHKKDGSTKHFVTLGVGGRANGCSCFAFGGTRLPCRHMMKVNMRNSVPVVLPGDIPLRWQPSSEPKWINAFRSSFSPSPIVAVRRIIPSVIVRPSSISQDPVPQFPDMGTRSKRYNSLVAVFKRSGMV
jgi:hypothetical protein